MELSRQEYPALLTSLQPNQAVNILNDRVRLIGKTTSDISDWLAERRRVEEAYVQGLRKLASHRPENPASLGVFREPWQSLIGSCDTYADSHETLARKIEGDVEKPLREFTGKGKEISGITTIQGNLASLARDVDEAQKKSNKILAKGNKADSSKLSSALSGVQDAQSQWESQAPFVFEQLQALDESRVNHVRDALTQLQTHEVDQLQRSRAVAESSLNSVLTIDTAEEISSFVAATSQGAPSLTATRRQSRHSTNLSSSSAGPPPATATSSDTVPPVPDIPSSLAPQQSTSLAPPAPPSDDVRSERSAATSMEQRTEDARVMPPPPTPSTEKKKSGFGGLRRLGTVMTRRKTEPKQPPVLPSPEKKSKRRNPLRRGSSSRNSMYQLNSPVASMTELADTSSSRRTPAAEPSVDRPPFDEPGPAETNGIVREERADTGAGLSNGHSSPPEERKPRPPSTIQEEGEHHPTTLRAPSAVDDITRAQQEAAAMEGEQPQFKLDIKNEPIQEEGGDSAQALSNVANTLRLGAQPPPRRAGTLRGRRDVRNTVFVPSNATPESVIQPAENSLAPLSVSPAARSPEDTRGADAMSIRSAHSLSSLSHGAVKHAEMTFPGLNASIVETVSAWFTGGQITKAIAIGEVAMAHNTPSPNPASPTPTPTTETIRLENFAVLEKVAPNPTFMSPLPGKSGEYTADLPSISRPQVAFKYQVHLNDANLASYAPVLLTPTWRVEPAQTSVILAYAFNPAFAAPGGSVALSGVVLAVSLDASAGRATACQSKPQGTFSREKGLIYWRLGDLALGEAQEGGPMRLLARFSTEGEAKPGGVEARWEIVGENALGVGSGLGISCGKGGEGVADPFGDETGEKGMGDKGAGAGEWRDVRTQRRVVSGKYVAN